MVRAEIDTELFAQITQQSQALPTIEINQPIIKNPIVTDAKTTIQLAKLRTQIKKLEKQLSVRADENKQHQLNELIQQLSVLQEDAS